MSDQPPPQSTFQVAGRVASDVVNGLKNHPLILGLIVLNVVGIVAAIWFLHNLGEAQASRFAAYMAEHKQTMELIVRLCREGG
jgi:hypothetical protein